MFVHFLLPAVLAAVSTLTASATEHHHHKHGFQRVERSSYVEPIIDDHDLDVYANHTLERRASSNFGLSSKNLRSGSVSIGFLPGFGEAKGPNTLSTINAKLPKPAAVRLRAFNFFKQTKLKPASITRLWVFIAQYRLRTPTLSVWTGTFPSCLPKSPKLAAQILSML